MPSLTLDIAKRYLFGKKSTNSINIITGISIFGISIGTAALILILSVFNGFEGLLSGMFNAFNPDIKVVPVEGKYFNITDAKIITLSTIVGVEAVAKSIEEVALFEYKGIQQIGMIKGVDSLYKTVTRIDTVALDGRYKLKGKKIYYAYIGAGLRSKLGINIDNNLNPLVIYMPSRKKKMMGAKEFNSKSIYPSGVFSVKSDSDYQYVIADYDMVSQLLEKKNQVSSLEIKLNPSANNATIKAINATLDELYPDSSLKIKDRYQQDESTLKVMRIEKWISFLISGMTMLLIAFNLIGALWMIVLDKEKDIAVMKALGFNNNDIKKIFFQLGLLITGIGMLVGFTLALILYFLQKEYGLIGVPSGFMMDAYPIQLRAMDFIIVTITVAFIGYMAAYIPSRKAAQTSAMLRGA